MNSLRISGHAEVPTRSIICLALVRPASRLACRCQTDAPVYGIYEFSRARGERELRFGDGSFLSLSASDHNDLVLLPEYDEAWMKQQELFPGG